MSYRFSPLDVDDLDLDNSDFENETNDEDESIDRPSWYDEKGESDYRDTISVNCMFCHGDAFDCPCCGGEIKRRKY